LTRVDRPPNSPPRDEWQARDFIGQRMSSQIQTFTKTAAFAAALHHDGITAPFVLDGPVNGECFKAYAEKVPVPPLSEGGIVLIGNLKLAKESKKLGKRPRSRAPDYTSCRAAHPA